MQEAAPELPQGYYLDNFWRILDAVEGLYDDLMSPQEHTFLVTFRALPLHAQRLYVRLLTRRGPCFRLDKISYDELPPALLSDGIEALFQTELLADAKSLPFEELLIQLTNKELQSFACQWMETKGWTQLRKAQRVKALADHAAQEEQYEPMTEALLTAFPMIVLQQAEVTLSFRLMMFGSLSYSLTDFVLEELGIVCYESYEIKRDKRLYQSREAIEEMLLLSQIREAVWMLLEEELVSEAEEWARPVCLPEREWAPTSMRYVERIRTSIGRALERQEKFEQALCYFSLARRPPARERRARILLKLGRLDEAASICQEMQEAPRDDNEAEVALRIEDKVLRARGERPPPKKRHRLRTTSLILAPHKEGVEAAVLSHYRGLGYRGFFSENHLWLGLFGLVCWDIIFAPVRGAFQHPFQRGPLDLNQPSFREQREALFMARWEELRREQGWRERVWQNFEAKQGLSNAFVDWSSLTRKMLSVALEHIPGSDLVLVCDRLCHDVKRHRRGLPDLFLCRPGGGYELVEVKGPGDQVRPEQRAWFGVLERGGVAISIAKVEWGQPAASQQLVLI